ncbi:MAG: sigma-54-dependent Fis family transcriptional regulator [Chlamydiae bacterium]|nr:sigma-54-dependent Fis family transcriptional regulator [Chlamydiota bacterium]MBI3266579.1 sigma-54-dependent Fis family transcriptional regulator [Chlamydiota bacterium]
MTWLIKDISLPSLLAVEDDDGVREALELSLKHLFRIHFSVNAEEALDYLKNGGEADVVTLDICLPGMSGLEAIPEMKKSRPDLPIIVVSAVGDAPTGVKAIKLGAYDYIVKPFMKDEIQQILDHAVESTLLKKKNLSLIREVAERFHPEHLIGISFAIKEVREKILQASSANSPVLITGETGTGKELVAKAIHYSSFHRSGPFIAINCAALPRELIESELFGHEKGAFTGASHQRKGAFEQAQNGTLFLDEIGELEMNVQAKLLRVLEEKKISRIGGTKPIALNVRLISATNKDLTQAIAKGEFRKDLYYRICIFPIHILPLRERKEDIPSLVNYWTQILQKEMGLEILPEFSPTLMDCFKQASWSGNVRELKNILEAMFLSHRKLRPLVLDVLHLPREFRSAVLGFSEKCPNASFLDQGKSFKDILEEHERKMILEALQKTGGKFSETAQILKVTPRILKYRIKKLGIEWKQ